MSTVKEIAEAIGAIGKLSAEEAAELRALIDECAEDAPPGVKIMDRATFEKSSKKVFRHYKPLLKALSE